MAFSLVGFIKGLLVQHESDRSKQLSVEIDSAATTNTKTTLKSAQTANRTISLPDATDTLVGKATTDTLTNKTIDADTNVILNIEDADIKALAGIDATKLADGSVTNTELQYINSVTSNVQTQIDSANSATATVASDLANHLADSTDAHDASAISNIPSGNLSATDIQSAVNELQIDIDTRATSAALTAHITDSSDAHTASAITNVPSGNLVATDVQSALNELQTEVDSIVSGVGVTSLTGDVTGTGPGATATTLATVNSNVGSFTNASITVNAKGLITAASTGSTGANTTLSNLTSPTDINQDLLFDNGSDKTLGFETTGTNPGKALTVKAGAAVGTNIAGGTLVLSAGNSTGTAGSTGITIAMPPANQASGSTVRTPVDQSLFASSISSNTFRLYAPTNGGVNFDIQNNDTNTILQQAATNSASPGPTLNITSGGNSGSGSSSPLTIATASKSVSGNSATITIQSGDASSGNSGGINITAGTASATRGSITANARSLTLNQTPLVFTHQTVGIATSEIQLSVNNYPIVKVTTTGASSIRGIEAGVDGQYLIIQHLSNNNLSFINQDTVNVPIAADRIITQTGTTVTSNGVGMFEFIYLDNRWQMLGNQL